MPDVRYVVLSDMHLGAENSILTELKNGSVDTDTLHESPVMIRMVDCLREVIAGNRGTEKPRLVLNGDLIELALTTTNKAAMAFQRFIELVMPDKGERLFGIYTSFPSALSSFLARIIMVSCLYVRILATENISIIAAWVASLSWLCSYSGPNMKVMR